MLQKVIFILYHYTLKMRKGVIHLLDSPFSQNGK